MHIFVFDIVNSSDIFDFSIYADDTCLMISSERNIYDKTLEQELTKVMDWFHNNQLLVNIKKTGYLFHGPFSKKVYIKGEHNLDEIHSITPLFFN